MALAVAGALVLFVALFLAALVAAVVVPAALRGVNAGERGTRHRRNAEGDRQQEENLGEGAGGHEQTLFFHDGGKPATPTAPVACAIATSERTSSYRARVRLRRAWVSADCDSSRLVVVAAPALSAASVTR